MTRNTLLKKLEQGYNENYCDGTYTLELVNSDGKNDQYLLRYTYKTGETIEVEIETSYLGEVRFYSTVHNYYYSNFNNHVKSVINVFRMLFDLIDTNKERMCEDYGVEQTTETEQETESTGTPIAFTDEDTTPLESGLENDTINKTMAKHEINSMYGFSPVGYGGFTKNRINPDTCHKIIDYDYNTQGWYSANAMQYEHNVRIYKAIRDGAFHDRLPHVRSAKEIRKRLEKTRPYSLYIYDDIKTRLRRIYNAKYYRTVVVLLEQLQEELERCASDYAEMFARKVNDALREWLK